MKEFKVGDRVSVYCHERLLRGATGTLTSIYDNHKTCIVKLDVTTPIAEYPDLHINQIRRLVKRKRRTFEINCVIGSPFLEVITFGEHIKPGERVRVREVLKK